MDAKKVVNPDELYSDSSVQEIFGVVSDTVVSIDIVTDEIESVPCRYVFANPEAALAASRYFVRRFHLKRYKVVFTPLKLMDLWEL